MRTTATLATADAILPMRVRYRREMNCQIVHDSIHRRAGWTSTYELRLDDAVAGFGTVANGGPWKGKPTIFEFYLLPARRSRAFDLFDVLLDVSGARLMEIQSNDALLSVILHTYARDICSEKIVFQDGVTTALPANDATLQQVTGDDETYAAIAQRQGGGEWRLQAGERVLLGDRHSIDVALRRHLHERVG